MKLSRSTHPADRFAIVGIALVLVSVSVVRGHSGATGIVKERMDAMSSTGDSSKRIADMFKGDAEFDRNSIVEAADLFIEHGSQMVELFPDTEESRTGSQTEALPQIWEQSDDFLESVNEFVRLSNSLKVAAEETEDAGTLRKAFFRTTKGCTGCHKIFRKPKE